MIVDERIITFINSLDTKNSEILEDIEREALADNCLLYTSDAADE